MNKIRVGVFHTNPIDHEVPLYRVLSWQEGIDLTVFYFSASGSGGSISAFGLDNIPYGGSNLLQGYSYRILKNYGNGRDWGPFRFINPEVFRDISGRNLDVIILNGYFYVSCWFVVVAALIGKVPILFRGETESILGRPLWKLYLRNFLLPRLYRLFEGFLTFGLLNEEHYRRYGVGEERLTRVPQTIDQTFAHVKKNSAAASSVRARYGFGDSTVVFIYLHKHRYHKRPLDVVKAFCQLDPGLDVGLLMCSDGPLRKEAEEYVRKCGGSRRIHFTGYVDCAEFVNLVCASDVLVVASEEPIGTVLYQALAAGLAILTSDRALCWTEVVKPGLNGLVFRSKWIESLAVHLQVLAENRALVDKMKGYSREFSRNVSLGRSVQGVLEALRKLRLG